MFTLGNNFRARCFATIPERQLASVKVWASVILFNNTLNAKVKPR